MSERKSFAPCPSLLPMGNFHTWLEDPRWPNMYDHLRPVCLICRWGTHIPGWELEQVNLHNHLLLVHLICRWVTPILGWEPERVNVHDHLLLVRLICWWVTPILGWEPKWVEVSVQSHDHLLPFWLICRWDFYHTWLCTWTSRGICVNPTIYYLSVSSADGISLIPGWAPGRAEAPVWTRQSTTCPSHLPMGFLPYLVENLDERRCLGKIMLNVSPSQGGMRSLLLQFFRESIQTSP